MFIETNQSLPPFDPAGVAPVPAVIVSINIEIRRISSDGVHRSSSIKCAELY
jgi:hypothetical protein